MSLEKKSMRCCGVRDVRVPFSRHIAWGSADCLRRWVSGRTVSKSRGIRDSGVIREAKADSPNCSKLKQANGIEGDLGESQGAWQAYARLEWIAPCSFGVPYTCHEFAELADLAFLAGFLFKNLRVFRRGFFFESHAVHQPQAFNFRSQYWALGGGSSPKRLCAPGTSRSRSHGTLP